MTLIIPDEVLIASKISPTELRIELAAYLYEKQRMSIGKARKLAGVSLIEFQKELVKRDICLHLDVETLNKELKNLDQL